MSVITEKIIIGEKTMSATERFELLKTDVFGNHSGKTPQKLKIPRKIKKFPSINDTYKENSEPGVVVKELDISPPAAPKKLSYLGDPRHIANVLSQCNQRQHTNDSDIMCTEGIALTPSAQPLMAQNRDNLTSNFWEGTSPTQFDDAFYTCAVFSSYINTREEDAKQRTAQCPIRQFPPPKRQVSQSLKELQKYGDKLSHMVDSRRLAALSKNKKPQKN